MTFQIRQLAAADYPFVISVLDQWWGGRQMADKLPRLFFEHFADTSFAAERDGQLAGFLVGFISQSRSGEAYIHFVGVDPAERGSGLGRLLYQAFFQAAEARLRRPGRRPGPLRPAPGQCLTCERGVQMRSSVAESGSPPKYWSRT